MNGQAVSELHDPVSGLPQQKLYAGGLSGLNDVTYREPQTTPSPVLQPNHGTEGTVVTLVTPMIIAPAKLAFNNLIVETRQMQDQGVTALVATVPPLGYTQMTKSVAIPVSICVLDKSNLVDHTWVAAEFAYTPKNDKQEEMYTLGELSMTKSTRPPKGNDIFFPFDTNKNINNPVHHYPASLQPPPVQYIPGATLPSFPDTTTNFTGMLTSANSNHLGLNNPRRPSSVFYMPNEANIMPVSNPANMLNLKVPMAPPPLSNIPPMNEYYFQYKDPARSKLDFLGNLEAMIQSWSPEEWNYRRRLVQFRHDKSSHGIQCSFQALSQSKFDLNEDDIVVSCIYWAEQNDYFITSVDCIYLLERLMDIHFSVEEKNRIRRNLEGFRPLTVSKCKPEFSRFFKLIMGFPHPKPRNIEKDVKVFPWRTLPFALQKIVTKCTASPPQYPSSANQSPKERRHSSLTSQTSSSGLSTPMERSPLNAFMETPGHPLPEASLLHMC